MGVFIQGQTIEIGYGDFVGDEDGGSYFVLVDVDTIEEKFIEQVFSNDNILYIEIVTEEQSIKWSKENPISQYLN